MPVAGSTETESSKDTGYYRMISETFGPLVKEKEADLPDGVFAVIFDKNPMEATGYAQCKLFLLILHFSLSEEHTR